ncbi:MAG: S46 family peptidase [Breznakibacter sp.]
MIKRTFIALIGFGMIWATAKADEGMWMPVLLQKLNIADMQAKGFKLSAEDVYSINQASLKDAVVLFGRGCTGELVSDQGLLLTNHHCGLSYIQQHSSLANNYLENGFWAMDKSEELSNPELTATILKYMKDVTVQALEGVDDQTNDIDREKRVRTNTDRIVRDAVKGTHYKASVRPFFGGNQYFLFVNEVFEDVRLVGAPPSSIGKFGGDTDNWVWPRHTGDFSVFRIYADANNQPAAYSPGNVPYKPAKHFKISTKGINENDFTMVFGYPGTTQQYVPSFHIEMLQNQQYPELVDLRSKKLDIIKKWMRSDKAIQIKYTSKDASIANAWKKWTGEIAGLKRLNAVAAKQEFEAGFQQWANAQGNTQYQAILAGYAAIYPKYTPLKVTEQYLLELYYRNGIEVTELANELVPLYNQWNEKDRDAKKTEKILSKTKTIAEAFFKDYDPRVDQEMTVAMLAAYLQKIPAEYKLDVFNTIDKKYKGNITAYATHLFKSSWLVDAEKTKVLLDMEPAKAINHLEEDAGWQLFLSISKMYGNVVVPQLTELNSAINRLNRLYIAAQMEYQPKKSFYPDANLTLRVAYGSIKGYKAADAVHYNYFTTLDGIIEKSKMGVYDYVIPERLQELYDARDFGPYAVNGKVPVAFVADNHTTGGNSGSPVLNDKGELVGINFDRAWDGITSDLVFNHEQSRNISLDIRYALFLIDKYAGAGYLLDEMELVW